MSSVVPLRPAPKDRTAAKRMRDYRKRKAGRVTPSVTVERQKAPSRRRLSSTVTVPAVTQAVTPSVTVERVPVDLVALRREIAEWTECHLKIERMKVIERRNHISWQVSRLGFLVVGMAFFVLLAVAAVS